MMTFWVFAVCILVTALVMFGTGIIAGINLTLTKRPDRQAQHVQIEDKS